MEEDCKRLEEKLQIAVQEHKKLSDYQIELDEAKLKIAQVEITQESWKKKYENAVDERNDFLAKISKLELELSNIKRTAKLEDSDDVKLKIARFQVENEALRSRCDSLVSERNTYKEKICELEIELVDTKKKIGSLEGRIRRNCENPLNSKNGLEKELSHYKDLVAQLSRVNNSKESRANELALKQRIQQLEQDLRVKDEKLNRLKDLEKIKDERDQLVAKLRNQAKQFEQYVKSQNQASAELNLSPHSAADSTDFQKIKEITAKEVREEMEQRVVKELRGIGEQHLERRKELEQKYKTAMLEWQTKYDEKNQAKLSQINQVSQIMGNKLEICNRELQSQKSQIEKLEDDLNKKTNELEEERNMMAQMMTKWFTEIKEIKVKEAEMNQEIEKLKSKEEELNNEIRSLKDKEKHVKSDADLWKHKYQVVKKTAHNYKVSILISYQNQYFPITF